MRFSTAERGRVFVVRLEDGDVVHECLERLAREQGITAATISALGGVDTGSRLVVGPREDRVLPPDPVEYVVDGVAEATGTGTIFCDESGQPQLHMHLACGRGEKTVTGCVRRGVRVWHVLEVIVEELVGTAARRTRDPLTGFTLLDP